ncbi:MAG: methionyl-tRNA formyltransferase, partial [Ignavibacteria bacterium]|nr:methionyl-tRNA formyltransferase [Ignavibacteria bacterium]
ANLVLETVKMIERGEVKTLEQDNTQATPAPKITKEIAKINWSSEANCIHNLIRGLSPIPCAWTTLEGKIVKIFKSKVSDEFTQSEPGKLEIIKDKMFVNTIDKKLEILELQIEGRKKMSVTEFLRGFRIESNEQLRFT